MNLIIVGLLTVADVLLFLIVIKFNNLTINKAEKPHPHEKYIGGM